MSSSPSPFSVYRIHVYDVAGGRFGVSRTEDWEEKWAASFATEKEAKDFIRKESLSATTLLTYLVDLPKSKWDAFIDEFCFTNDMYHAYRRLFIGPVDRRKMKTALNNLGVRVEPNPTKPI